MPRVGHSFIQQAGSNGPHRGWGGAESECVGPKLGVHESDEMNEENHNLRFSDIFRLLCVNISPGWIGSRRPLCVSRRWVRWRSPKVPSATTRPRSTARICIARQVVSASTVLSAPAAAAVASHSVAPVSALLLVRGAVQTARWHRHLTRQGCGGPTWW
jgi:hypothetical protein